MTKTQKITYPIIAVLAIVLVARFVHYWRQKPSEGPASTEAPMTAAQRTAALVEERMNDKEYMAGLKSLQMRQTELAKTRSQIAKEYAAWRSGWMVSNEAARAISEKMEALAVKGNVATNEEFRALAAELDKLALETPEAKAFTARRDKVETEIDDHQHTIKAFIGARMRKQAEEHAGEESAAAEKRMSAKKSVSGAESAKGGKPKADADVQKQPLNK